MKAFLSKRKLDKYVIGGVAILLLVNLTMEDNTNTLYASSYQIVMVL